MLLQIVEKIVVLYKDRLLRFGYELLKTLCSKYGTMIEVVDNTEKAEEREFKPPEHYTKRK